MTHQPLERRRWPKPSVENCVDRKPNSNLDLSFPRLNNTKHRFSNFPGDVLKNRRDVLKQLESAIDCRMIDAGIMDYSAAYQLQRQVLESVIGASPSTLILCEHFPVFTLGRLASEANILVSQEAIEKAGAKIIRVDRGGEITFHGPGQLVIYPIFRLSDFGKDLKIFMQKLEQVAVDLLASFGIVANSKKGKRGVWVKAQKIASIGIGVRKWVSFHGMAININTDLRFFSMIRPCGLEVEMTTMEMVLKKEIDLVEAKKEVLRCFARHFYLEFFEGENNVES